MPFHYSYRLAAPETVAHVDLPHCAKRYDFLAS